MTATAVPVKSYVFANGATVDGPQINSNYDTLYTEVNGNIGDANMVAAGFDASRKCILGTVTAPLLAAGVLGKNLFSAATNLVITRSAANSLTITCTALVIVDGSNNTYTAQTVSKVANIDVVGVNGLDVGVPAVGWYHAYLIMKADGTVGSLISLSATAPTMPAGYVGKLRVGACRIKSIVPSTFTNIVKRGYETQYTGEGSGGVNVLTAGTQGLLTSVDISTAVPPQARAVRLSISTDAVQPTGVKLAANSSQDVLSILGSVTAVGWGNIVLLLIETAQTIWYAVNSGKVTLAVLSWFEMP